MTDTSTTDSDRTEHAAGLGRTRRRGAGGGVGQTRGLATYHRLRSIALETRVRALEAQLERRERQLDETVTRYEQLLQRPEEDWVVTTACGPDVEPAGDD